MTRIGRIFQDLLNSQQGLPGRRDNAGCWCYNCLKDVRDPESGWPVTMSRMILCPVCGNKRCPMATDHSYTCTGSNNPGQPGSRY